MSLPDFDPQRSFFDAAELCGRVLSQAGAKRFKLFREHVWPALAKQRSKLAAMYCQENGRPAEEPVRMLGVLILQFMERFPDRQAAEACTYDLRWKHALDLEVDEVVFHPTSLVKFRNRLVEHGLESVGFDGVLEGLREAGYGRKKKAQRLDSTHIAGLVSSMSRLECVRETLRLGLQQLEQDMEAREEPLAETLYVEAGYTSGAELERFERTGRALQGPVQAAPVKGKRFSSEQFDVDVEHRTAICPAGHPSRQCSRVEQSSGRTVYCFEWTRACGDCELRGQCIQRGQSHRTLTVGEHHTHVQARRRAMKTEAFGELMHRRNGIEGTISELVRTYGFRRTRYRGLAKTRLQNLLIGAACNLKRWSRRLEWESWGGPSGAVEAKTALC